jgi:hypothetical protein
MIEIATAFTRAVRAKPSGAPQMPIYGPLV